LPLLPACAPVATTTSASAIHAHVHATLEQPDGGHRWKAGSELRVDVSRLDPCDRRAVFRAFDSWLGATRLNLTVREAAPGDANVTFTPPLDPASRFRGRTELSWEGPWVTGARVQVALVRHGTPVSGSERKRILVHEVGHVLGLAHSHRLASVMHPDPPGNSVDDIDLAALTFLYGAPSAAHAVATVAAPDRDLR
jgi:hypothetical protein